MKGEKKTSVNTYLMLRAQSATKEYIRARNILQYFVSQLFCTQVFKPQNSEKSTESVSTQNKTIHTCTNIKYDAFEELVPSILPLLKKKKHTRLGRYASIVDPSV